MKAALAPAHRSILEWEFPDDGASLYDKQLRHEHFGSSDLQTAKL